MLEPLQMALATVEGQNATQDESKSEEKKQHANYTNKQREWMLAALVAARDQSEPMTSSLKTETVEKAKRFLKRWHIHTTMTTTPSTNSLRNIWKNFFNPNKTIAKVQGGGRPRKESGSDAELGGEKRPKTKKKKSSPRKPKKPATDGDTDRPKVGRPRKKTTQNE